MNKNYIAFFVFSMLGFFSEKSYAQVNTETLHQIQALLNEKKARTPAEQKIDSRLLQAVREKAGLPMAQGVFLEPANVNADNAGNLMVDIKANVTDQLLTGIQTLGGRIIYPSAEYHTVRATINLSMVKIIAAYPEVLFIQPAVQSRLVDVNNYTPDGKIIKSNFTGLNSIKQKEQKVRAELLTYLNNKKFNNYTAASPQAMPVVSEGDRTHRADDARNTYGYSGEGVRIGIISDSYNATGGADADVHNGELPGPGNPFGDTMAVTIFQDYKSGSDEGRAMTQIVHDLAPKAQLFFATADLGEASFATNIKTLRDTYNCDIIIDDVEYLDEPPFQDGIVAQAVNYVTAEGAMYFSSAGNYGALQKNTSAVYEGDFNDEGSLSFADTSKAGSINNFGTVTVPVNGDIITASFPASTLHGNSYLLEWSDALGESANDYDLFLVKSNGTIKASSTNVQNGTQDPYENIFFFSIGSGDRLVVFKDSASAVRAFRLNAGFATYNGLAALAIGTAGQTFGHSSAANAFSVAATPASTPFGTGQVAGPYPDAFSSVNKTETFSSDGPRRIFYNADSTPISPNNFLFATNGGVNRMKPDVTAADGVSTNVANATEFSPFFGTSAAAPHAGAIAALLKSADPTLTATDIRNLLTGTALDIELPGYDYLSGSGILQAYQAMAKLNPAPSANLVLDTVEITEGDISDHNGYIDPGESGNIIAGIQNISLAAATSVKGTLTTTTPGVTITQPNAVYGKINAGGDIVLNTGTPYLFQTDTSVACGTVIDFYLTVTYNGGKSPSKVFELSVGVGQQPYKNIISTLGNPTVGATYSVSTGKQTGRLSRGVVISTCDSLIPNPGVFAAAGFDPRTFDAYTFTNMSSATQCVQTIMKADSGLNLYCAAYNDSGFVPDSPSVHFLADPGQSKLTQSFSFEAAPGKSFTVVVNEVLSGTLTGTPYNLSVSLSNCSQSVLAVKMFNLKAIADQNKLQVPLNWTVSDDNNVHYYIVQRSKDGINFTDMQSVQPAASLVEKTYTYTDASPFAGNNYYRIKEVDMDGRTLYSNVVKATINSTSIITLLPNPASTYINVMAVTDIKQIQLFSSKAQLLQTVTPQANSYYMLIGNLIAGEYFLRIETADGITNKKFVKQ